MSDFRDFLLSNWLPRLRADVQRRVDALQNTQGRPVHGLEGVDLVGAARDLRRLAGALDSLAAEKYRDAS